MSCASVATDRSPLSVGRPASPTGRREARRPTKVRNRGAPSTRLRLLAAVAGAGWAAAFADPAPLVSAVEVIGNTRTRDEVVLRELLFAVGDPADSAVVAETERNLRALLFLGRPEIRLEPVGDGTVRAIVSVEDLWARAVSPLLSGDAHEVSAGAVALDYNFLGRGQVAQVTLFHDAVRGNRGSAHYRAPRLAGSRVGLSVDAGVGQEGHDLDLTVSQGFWSLAAPWAYGASLSSHRSLVRLYAGGHLAARYGDRTEAAGLWLSASRGARWKVRPGIRLAVSDRAFRADPPFTDAPVGRRRVVPSLSLTLWRPQYATARFLNLMGPVEDLQVGSWLTASAGVSARTLGSDRDFPFLTLTLSPRHASAAGWYLFATAGASGRWREGGYWHVISSSRVLAYRRLTAAPGAPTAALRFEFDALSRPEDEGSQFLLGVDAGLRGYGPRRFDGTRRLLAGAELRPVFARRRSWSLGAALFAEAGAAWSPGRSAPTARPAAGMGLRVGLPRIYNTPVLRVDLAHGTRGGAWQLSFGMGQYF